MTDLIIPAAVIAKTQMSHEEFLVDLAVYLYDKERLSMGQAKKLAGLTQLEFQKEMSKRDVYLKYDIEDLEEDLRNLRTLDRRVDSQ